MDCLPKSYTLLFNAVTDEIEEMDAQNYGKALQKLKEGQKAAEDAYIKEGE